MAFIIRRLLQGLSGMRTDIGFKKTAINLMILAVSMAILANTAGAEEFRVGTGDKLSIVVYEHDDLTMDVRINGDGTIKLPFLGRVKVSGHTTGEISNLLTKRYVDEEYLIAPQIIVSINEYKSRKASILGQVKRPGRYELDEDTTIMILVTMASGYTGKASKKHANLIRKKDGKRVVEKKVPLDIIVKPGDIVIIPESIF